jgi:hypothetical protein
MTGRLRREDATAFDKISKKRYIFGYGGIKGNQVVIPGEPSLTETIYGPGYY